MRGHSTLQRPFGASTDPHPSDHPDCAVFRLISQAGSFGSVLLKFSTIQPKTFDIRWTNIAPLNTSGDAGVITGERCRGTRRILHRGSFTFSNTPLTSTP
jgi:hypothetical protein